MEIEKNQKTIPQKPQNVGEQILPRDLAVIVEKLDQLKLKSWKKAMELDWQALKPADQEIIAPLVTKWLASELSDRRSHAINRRIDTANFIRIQTVDNFDFNYNASTRALQKEYLKLHNAAANGTVPKAVFVGNTGLGKTHLARALGYAACQSENSVLFIKAAQIVNKLATAKATNTLEKELRKFVKPKLLICDELGYVSMGTEEGNLFFQAISDRHDRGLGTIVTTNYAFGLWNQIFAAESTALVIVERLTADAEVFYLEGPSYPQSKKKKRE
jgi:DNA replication protein DnaC